MISSFTTYSRYRAGIITIVWSSKLTHFSIIFHDIPILIYKICSSSLVPPPPSNILFTKFIACRKDSSCQTIFGNHSAKENSTSATLNSLSFFFWKFVNNWNLLARAKQKYWPNAQWQNQSEGKLYLQIAQEIKNAIKLLSSNSILYK